MLKETEPRSIPAATFDLLDRLAGAIAPDSPALSDWTSRYLENHRSRIAVDLEIVRARVPSGARVLEYGAVPLLMTVALAELEYRVHALDIEPERFSGTIARLDLEVQRCDIESELVPFPSESFDLILFNELFEHLRIDPIFTLGECHRVLKPGGLLMLSTPNLRSFRGLRNLLAHNLGHSSSGGIYEQYEKLRSLGHMGHVREYTTREVVEFLHRIGFSVDTIVYRGGHGAGLVGLAERVTPSLRPFFSVIASKKGSSDDPRRDPDNDRPGRRR